MSYFEEHYDRIRYPIPGDMSPFGLRRAQVGAIHAIASHFTQHRDVSQIDPALVVMPTGSGKTAVLIMSAFVLRAKRALVITPSRLVRTQVARSFETLQLLKQIGALQGEFENPAVQLLDSRLTWESSWRELEQYDVVVSTPNCTSPAYEQIESPPADLFDVLLIDEAHHQPAKTWAAILGAFPHARKVLFTATPFRLDKREIPGSIVYEFPIGEAFADGIIEEISYVPVAVSGSESEDVAIARKAEQVYREDQRNGFENALLIRTDTKKHAVELSKLYKANTGLQLELVSSDYHSKQTDRSIERLRAGELDGVICVDMLGEGFDFRNLKIAAVHRPHKSLPITLQFIGRFTRPGSGQAKLIAMPQTIRLDAEQLYKEGKAWQEIIPTLYQSQVDRERRVRQALSTFTRATHPVLTTPEVDDLSLYSLTPLQHAKVYRVLGDWNSDVEIELQGLEIIRQDRSEELCTISVLTRQVAIPRWASSQSLARTQYDLSVIYIDGDTGLLFISSSRHHDSLYDQIAAQVSTGRFRPLNTCEINRVLIDLASPRFFNVGMRNRLLNSR